MRFTMPLPGNQNDPPVYTVEPVVTSGVVAPDDAKPSRQRARYAPCLDRKRDSYAPATKCKAASHGSESRVIGTHKSLQPRKPPESPAPGCSSRSTAIAGGISARRMSASRMPAGRSLATLATVLNGERRDAGLGL